MSCLFEGVVPWEVKLMLYNFIEEKKFFSIEELNPLTGEAVISRLGGVLVFKNSL